MKNRSCTALWFLIATLGLAWSSAATAASTPNKHFSMTMGTVTLSPTNDQVGNTVPATISNDNPITSNAQISSWIISVANLPGTTITGVAIDPNVNFVAQVLTPNSVGVKVKNDKLPTLKPGQNLAVTITFTGCGDAMQWSAQVWSGGNFNGGAYVDDSPTTTQEQTTVSCGAVGCAVGNDALAGGAVSATFVNGSQRGPYNQDGACSATPVNYFVTNLLATQQYVHVRTNTSTDPDAVFFYIIQGSSATPPAPQVAWDTDANAPIFITAPACSVDPGQANPRTPAPFGTVTVDSGGTITVDLSSAVYAAPTGFPFPIILGPKPYEEYLLVTAIDLTGTVWSVTDRFGNPRTGVNTNHLGKPVMSTPKVPLPSSLPLGTCHSANGTAVACPYAASSIAQMCYIPGPDAAIFDIGDGYVKPSI